MGEKPTLSEQVEKVDKIISNIKLAACYSDDTVQELLVATVDMCKQIQSTLTALVSENERLRERVEEDRKHHFNERRWKGLIPFNTKYEDYDEDLFEESGLEDEKFEYPKD